MKLEVQELRAGYGAKLVLDGVGLTVPEGSIVTLLGPNGCGKSTLLKVIGRLLKPKSGNVLLDGKAVHACDTAALARRMAILPQLHHASGEITVNELVGFGRFPHRTGLGVMNAHDREVVAEVLRMTRLTELRNRRIATLSGGERQRAWIAMTLAQQPEPAARADRADGAARPEPRSALFGPAGHAEGPQGPPCRNAAGDPPPGDSPRNL